MTQTALAERVGVSRQWVAGIERGKPRAELGMVLRTLEILDLEVTIEVNGRDRQAGNGASNEAVEPARVLPLTRRGLFGRWLPITVSKDRA